jgi:Na+/melibiose symporter-like transporter
MCFEVGGTMVGVFVYTGFYLGLVGTSKSGCEAGSDRKSDPTLRASYHFHALTLGIVTIVSLLITTVTVREQSGESELAKRWM